MEIFYNSSAPGYQEIVSYGPKWWTEYKEMDAVYMFEGWLLDILAKKMEQEVKNLFPSQADNPTLIKYEKMLCIEHDAEITIEERRRIVQAYYSGTGHLSKSVILQLIRTYTNHEGEVFWNGPTLCIEFNNNKGEFISIGILQKVIERRIPAHIPFQTRCTCKVHLGLRVETEVWEKRFIQAGLIPKVNVVLNIAREKMILKTAAKAVAKEFSISGSSGSAGTYPVTNKGLGIVRQEISFKPTGRATKVSYLVAGDSGNAGIYPITSTELQATEDNILPKIKTESWKVVYPICGDALGI